MTADEKLRRARRQMAGDGFRRCVAGALHHWNRVLECERLAGDGSQELSLVRSCWQEAGVYLSQMEVGYV